MTETNELGGTAEVSSAHEYPVRSGRDIGGDLGIGAGRARGAEPKQMTKLPVVPVPGARFQPIAAEEVAARLAELALGPPAGLVPELGGPKVYEMRELVRGYLRARGKHRLLIPVRPPGKAARAVREGANLAPERAVGRRTWEEFLAERVG